MTSERQRGKIQDGVELNTCLPQPLSEAAKSLVLGNENSWASLGSDRQLQCELAEDGDQVFHNQLVIFTIDRISF
jgi:hypothetical protein